LISFFLVFQPDFFSGSTHLQPYPSGGDYHDKGLDSSHLFSGNILFPGNAKK
jgi:hypothetical protein